MSRVRQTGFTIIEVMLVLAVTGALMLGVLASVQLSVNEQRYRDTLLGVQNELQKQYNETAHVVNLRDDTSDITECNAARGASNCIILGRLIRVTNEQISSSSVVAQPSTDGVAGNPENGIPDEVEDNNLSNDPTTEEEYFALYDFFSAPESVESYDVPWAARINNEHDGPDDDQEFRMFILRSPRTGLVYTYSRTVAAVDGIDTALITQPNRTTSRSLCIPREGLGNSASLGVTIQPDARTANAIELMTSGSSTCAA